MSEIKNCKPGEHIISTQMGGMRIIKTVEAFYPLIVSDIPIVCECVARAAMASRSALEFTNPLEKPIVVKPADGGER